MKITQLTRLTLAIAASATIATANAEPKVAVMETAFGNRAMPESLAMAKEAGYAGVQMHTGSLDDDGVLTLAQPEVIQAFKAARKAEGVEIVSLCAGEMNKNSALDPDTRKAALSIATQSIEACKALDVPVLLVPFFGKASFGDDPEDPKFKAAVSLLAELLPIAKTNDVILGLECASKQPAIDHILKELDHPHLKVYYDTGNMQNAGEDIYAVIRQWGPEKICQIHLKPVDSPRCIFGDGKTDLAELAAAIKETGYDAWFVFEAGGGKKTLGVPFAAENRKGISKFCKKL